MQTQQSRTGIKLAALGALMLLLWLGYTPNMSVDVLVSQYASQESEFVRAENGLRVHFRDQGRADGPVLVMLHGNSNSLHMFEPLVDALKRDFRVVTLDFPGHGLTGAHPSNRYEYPELVDALELVVEHLSLDNYTLLGHSMGGWVAWRYAVEQPSQLRSLILMSASGMPLRPEAPKSESGLGFKLLNSPIGPLLSRYAVPKSAVISSTRQSVYHQNTVSEELITRAWELLRHPENRAALAHRAGANREPDKAALAKQIVQPTLLIWGDQDRFVHPSAAKSFSEYIERAETVMLADVGHMPMVEATDRVAEAVRHFESSQTHEHLSEKK